MDLDFTRFGRSKAINISSSGDNTIHTVTAGTRFVVYHLFLEAEGAVDVTIKSGSTALSGAINFAANDEKDWKNAPIPVFRGDAVGENFIINLGGAVQVNGFAFIAEATS